jgi:hypothetical protein
MDFCSGSIIPAFRRHVTILNLKQLIEQFRILHSEEVGCFDMIVKFRYVPCVGHVAKMGKAKLH